MPQQRWIRQEARARSRPRRAILSVVAGALVAAGCAGTAAPPRPGTAIAPTASTDPRAPAIAAIVAAMANDDAPYRRLVALCDGYGHRLSGSPGLAAAIGWASAALRADGHDNVAEEPVDVPVWVRGAEDAAIVAPTVAGAEVPLAMLGLGGSIGTAAEGVSGEVVVVGDEASLAARAGELRGRIVLFNNPMPTWSEAEGSGYGHCVRFRVHGASMAAAHGAIAVLVRSVTARSLRSPHTGALHYRSDDSRIPAAAVSTEDADRIARLVAAGQSVRVRLRMAAKTLPPVRSANVVAELRGREHPEQIVIISGHLDSWDVGQGAHDDGAGVVMAMSALHALRKLGLRPRRTIRVVLWTNEENGLGGARAYRKEHDDELRHHVSAIEADAGGFAPVAFGVFVEDKARERRVLEAVAPLLPLLRPLAAMKLMPGHSAPDVSRLHDAGVPGLGLFTHGERYFDVHHTEADTVDKVDPGELARSAAALAALAFWLAEAEQRPDFR